MGRSSFGRCCQTSRPNRFPFALITKDAEERFHGFNPLPPLSVIPFSTSSYPLALFHGIRGTFFDAGEPAAWLQHAERDAGWGLLFPRNIADLSFINTSMTMTRKGSFRSEETRRPQDRNSSGDELP